MFDSALEPKKRGSTSSPWGNWTWILLVHQTCMFRGVHNEIQMSRR